MRKIIILAMLVLCASLASAASCIDAFPAEHTEWDINNLNNVCGCGYYRIATIEGGKVADEPRPDYDVTLNAWIQTTLVNGADALNTYDINWSSYRFIQRIIIDSSSREEDTITYRALSDINKNGTLGHIQVGCVGDCGALSHYALNRIHFCSNARSSGGGGSDGGSHGVPEFSTMTLAIAVVLVGLGIAVIRNLEK